MVAQLVLRFVFFVTCATFLILFCLGITNDTITTIAFTCANFLTMFYNLCVMFYLNFKLTGTFVQESAEPHLKWQRKLLCYYFISRAFQGTYGILMTSQISNKEFISYILAHKDGSSATIVIFVAVCIEIFLWGVTEQLPLIYSVRAQTIELLSGEWQTKANKGSLYTDGNTSLLAIMEDDIFEQENPNIKLFEATETFKTNNNSMGVVKKGRFRGRLVVMREIECELSRYLVEEIRNQIQEMKELRLSCILNIKLSVIQETKAYFISEYCEVSLVQFIAANKPMAQRMRIALRISQAIQEIHRQDKPHGTLKATNIYLHRQEVRLADHGLLALKKFLNLTKGYANKSIYTAPELFAERSLIVAKPTKPGDVYGFGMIMYQLFTGIVEYRNLSLKQVELSFKENLSRPKIPNTLPNNLKNLIRNCWQQEPSLRPKIEEITLLLQQYSRASQG